PAAPPPPSRSLALLALAPPRRYPRPGPRWAPRQGLLLPPAPSAPSPPLRRPHPQPSGARGRGSPPSLGRQGAPARPRQFLLLYPVGRRWRDGPADDSATAFVSSGAADAPSSASHS